MSTGYGPEFTALVNGLVTMAFACEPETYPVFIKWAEDHGYTTGPLTREALEAGQRVLATMSVERIPEVTS